MSELHQKLMDAAYDRWQDHKEWSKEEFHDSLNEFHDSLNAQERFAVHTGNFCYQVQNGGFMQWFDNQYGTASTAKYLLRAMERVDTDTSKSVSVLLKQYQQIIGDRDPSRHYSETDAEEWEELHERLNKLDHQFYDIDDQFLKDCEAHLQKGGW